MIENQRLFAVLGVLVMVLAALGPAGVLADEDSDELDVVVAQNDDYEVTITVTENGTPVEGANVTVDSRAVVTVYDGEGEYVTDANGTVNLPAPEDDIKVDITVSYNNSTVTRAVELNANETDDEDDDSLAVNVTQADDGNATVTVTDNGTPASGANVTVETVRPFDEYNGTGEYVADDDGTVDLPAPEETVKIWVRASYEGEHAVNVTTLSANESDDEDDEEDGENFGQELQEYLGSMNFSNPKGLAVADYVVQNNPGADEGRGPPDDHPIFGDDGELDIDVTQDENGTVTVTVTENGTAAAGANVTVETVRPFDEYNGTGEYVADANGTVELPAPEKVVGVTITAEYNDSTETEDERLVPDEFGPPDDAGDEGDDKGDGEGPPDDAGDDEGDGEGPPDDAGDDEGDGEGPPDDVGDEGDGEGPPDDAGT